MQDNNLEEPLKLPANPPLYPYLVIGFLAIILGFYLLLTPGTPLYQSPQKSPESSNEQAPLTQQSTMAPTFAFVDTLESSYGQAAQELQELLKQENVSIEIAPRYQQNGESVGELQLANLLKNNTVQIAFITSSPLSNLHSDLVVLDLPYLFDSYAHIDAFYASQEAQQLINPLEQKAQSIPLGFAEVGRRILSSSKPITDLNSLANKKIRIMQSTAYQEAFQLWGAKPVPARVDKIKEMSKEGLIDGADRTYPTYWDFELYDVHKYILESYHTYTCKILLVNKSWFETLTPKQQAHLKKSALKICSQQTQQQRQANKQVKQRVLSRSDLELNLLSENNKAQLRQAAQPLYDQYRKQFSQDWIRIIESYSSSKKGENENRR